MFPVADKVLPDCHVPARAGGAVGRDVYRPATWRQLAAAAGTVRWRNYGAGQRGLGGVGERAKPERHRKSQRFAQSRFGYRGSAGVSIGALRKESYAHPSRHRAVTSLYPLKRLLAGRHCRLARPGWSAGGRPRIPVF
jgi:hypothetical protein